MNEIRVIKDICYDPPKELLLDLYLPEVTGPLPVFVFFHGGGFEDYRQKEMGEPLSRYLASQGILCVNPAYRHYPKARFPDFIEDGAAAVAWVKNHIQEYADAGSIFIGGHSAGGHLSMLHCFDEHYLGVHGLNSKTDIAGYLFISGQPTTHMNVLKEDDTDSRAVLIDERAPLYHVRGNDGPPLLITCTDNDIQNRLEQTDLLVGTLKHFDYQSPVEYHVIQGFGHNNCLLPDEKHPHMPSPCASLIHQFIEKYKDAKADLSK